MSSVTCQSLQLELHRASEQRVRHTIHASPLHSCLGGIQLLDKIGNGVEEIGNESYIGDLEDGCVGVLVDGDNQLGLFHTCQVLDSARDTDSDIQLGSYDFTGLTNL